MLAFILQQFAVYALSLIIQAPHSGIIGIHITNTHPNSDILCSGLDSDRRLLETAGSVDKWSQFVCWNAEINPDTGNAYGAPFDQSFFPVEP